MDLISSRYRKPKGRPTKRRKMLAENSKKRWQKSSKTVDEKNSNSMVLQRDTLSEPSTSSQPEASYIFTHKAVFSELLQKVPCKYCTNCTLVIKQHHSMGYSTKMELLCESCHESYGSVFSSFQEEAKNSHDINSKLVSAFLSIGRGHAALETFSSVLNMPTMDRKTFAKCMHNLSVKNKEEIIDVSVSYDGTWQKRGHTSNLGLGIIIDILSGLVLDFEVLSKYCHNCVVAGRDMGVDSAEFHIWQKGHADECDKNFDGTSGAMEMHAALIMWRRSISDCQMRFVSMLSDGDSKTFQFLSDNKIYGSDIKIEKEECLNHISKRLGTSLRNKVKEWKVKKVTLGGRKQGSLTDKNITKLQNYYRKAIKDNVPDTDKMKTAIYASLMHCSSTDKKPMHGKCPEGESSWCFYKRAIAKASDTILERCVAGKTQNSNESLHSCIWRKCPKEVFVSKRRLEIAVTDAIEKHNLGYVKSLEAKEDSCLNDSFSLTIAERQDKRRISQNISTKQKRKRNATNTNAAYSAGAF
ncbi:uncharacterized protein TNCV_1373081 [Trichonephila clavipes]|uniref:Mutator-like transposase domain-containing protein n=1 Tax=Trichonephila clavipes TaxID=2585209 RepID=A0A8X6WHH3_TRICX|nr:uncharacterized protein TNCV_1373081 [Trichonephila clavipes]